MRKNKTFMVVGLLIAVLCLGIGYAAISNVNLSISGTASATASDDNFSVKFDQSVSTSTFISRGDGVSAAYSDDLAATISVSGLTTEGDYATATYTTKNYSDDLTAYLSFGSISNDNTSYFEVSAVFSTNDSTATLVAGDTVTVTVTVTLTATPSEDQTATITVPIVASATE